MEDRITLDRIQNAHPNIRLELGFLYKDIISALKGSAICRFSHVTRTFDEQEYLYAQGRTRPGKVVTNARAGKSYHNFGLAFDIVLLKDKDKNGTFETASWETDVDFDGDGIADWTEIVEIAEFYNFECGVNFKIFKDYPHFQKTFGYTTNELLNKINKKQTLKNTNYPIL
jgi:peptidoglycan L-alanyl-D-glutamate endopeptidase CwlK